MTQRSIRSPVAPPVRSRRAFVAAAALLAVTSPRLATASGDADPQAAAWRALREPGAIVLMRHATAPGVGDPAGMRLGDCASQRNLDERGRNEARQLGQAFRERGIDVGRVLTSRWCRARDTATLAFAEGPRPLRVEEEPAFDSFFEAPGSGEAQTRRARALLQKWKGPGALVVVTHQVNIRALAGVSPASAEAWVVRVPAGEGPLAVIGRVTP